MIFLERASCVCHHAMLHITNLESSLVLCAALQAGTILIIALGSRLPQIMLNMKRGNSGELSTTTSALNLAGNLARVMTTIVLTQARWPVLAGLSFFPDPLVCHCQAILWCFVLRLF